MQDREDIGYICAGAVKHFGKEKQKMKFVEEVGELLVEIGRDSFDRSHKRLIAEEIADVTIMLRQLQIIFDCRREVQECIDWKAERLWELITKEEEE